MAIPELEIHRIKAKMDTGAKTSALHATKIRYQRRDEQIWVEFSVHPDAKNPSKTIRLSRPLHDERNIKSSLGHMTLRPIVEVELHLGQHRFPIDLSLIDRSLLGFDILLGRRALQKKFLIDPSKSNLRREVQK